VTYSTGGVGHIGSEHPDILMSKHGKQKRISSLDDFYSQQIGNDSIRAILNQYPFPPALSTLF
jgi:hypothetical protein